MLTTNMTVSHRKIIWNRLGERKKAFEEIVPLQAHLVFCCFFWFEITINLGWMSGELGKTDSFVTR